MAAYRHDAGENKLVLSVAVRSLQAGHARLQRHTTEKMYTIKQVLTVAVRSETGSIGSRDESSGWTCQNAALHYTEKMQTIKLVLSESSAQT